VKITRLLSLALLALMTTLPTITARAASGGGGGSASTAPVMVVDSKGTVVGQEFPIINSGQDAALRKINGLWFALQVTTAGFAPTNLDFLYTTADCSGTPYLFGQSGTLTVPPEVQGSTLYYPASTGTVMTINSDHAVNADGSSPGCTVETFPHSVVPVSTFDLSTLKLVPPFSLK
jgi:hypothetical protein